MLEDPIIELADQVFEGLFADSVTGVGIHIPLPQLLVEGEQQFEGLEHREVHPDRGTDRIPDHALEVHLEVAEREGCFEEDGLALADWGDEEGDGLLHQGQVLCDRSVLAVTTWDVVTMKSATNAETRGREEVAVFPARQGLPVDDLHELEVLTWTRPATHVAVEGGDDWLETKHS